MDQILVVASDITTLLTPLLYLFLFIVLILIIKLLITVNKTAGAVKETTFLVNNLVHNSFFTVTSFIASMFEGKKKR